MLFSTNIFIWTAVSCNCSEGTAASHYPLPWDGKSYFQVGQKKDWKISLEPVELGLCCSSGNAGRELLGCPLWWFPPAPSPLVGLSTHPWKPLKIISFQHPDLGQEGSREEPWEWGGEWHGEWDGCPLLKGVKLDVPTACLWLQLGSRISAWESLLGTGQSWSTMAGSVKNTRDVPCPGMAQWYSVKGWISLFWRSFPTFKIPWFGHLWGCCQLSQHLPTAGSSPSPSASHISQHSHKHHRTETFQPTPDIMKVVGSSLHFLLKPWLC